MVLEDSKSQLGARVVGQLEKDIDWGRVRSKDLGTELVQQLEHIVKSIIRKLEFGYSLDWLTIQSS